MVFAIQSTWPDRSVRSNEHLGDRAIDVDPAPEVSAPDPTAKVEDSDEHGPLRLTVARATIGEDGEWAPLAEHVRLASGKRVPGTRYRIVRWLGEGGMGVVFEAIHVDIQRPVALKILKPGVAGAQQQRDRFIDEARAVAQVDSRFVVDVLDFGELPDGRPFYTMELLDPISLQHELRDGPLAIERALPILRQCCKALAAIHAQGLAHRDVKPQNVLLQAEDGRPDAVRLVDFGIAAAFGSNPRLAGTAMYMAPEQIRGEEFDGRLDIYGLGCLAYELLTGVPPFEGTTTAGIIHSHLHAPVVRPSARAPSLSRAIDAIVLRCLAKRPADRYASMPELEAALCEVQIALGITTPWDDLPLPAIADGERVARLHRMLRTASPRRRFGPRLRVIAGAFVVGLASAVAVMASVDGRTHADRSGYAAAIDELEGQVAAARVAGSRAYWAYPPADEPDYPTALKIITALEDDRGPLRHFAQIRAEQLRDEFARTLVRLGDQYWSAPHGRPFAVEYYAQALLFDDADPRALERSSLTTAQLGDVATRASSGQLTRLELELGEVLRALAEADPEVRRARIEALLADESSPLASSARTRAQLGSLVGLAEEVEQIEQIEEADETEQTEQTEQRSKRRPAPAVDRISEAERAHRYARRAAAALARGDRDAAESLFVKALDLDPKLADAHAGLAEIHFARGNYREAASTARRAAKLRPRDRDLQMLLGDSSVKIDRYDAARRAYQAAARLGHPKAARRLEQLDEVAP